MVAAQEFAGSKAYAPYGSLPQDVPQTCTALAPGAHRTKEVRLPPIPYIRGLRKREVPCVNTYLENTPSQWCNCERRIDLSTAAPYLICAGSILLPPPCRMSYTFHSGDAPLPEAGINVRTAYRTASRFTCL